MRGVVGALAVAAALAIACAPEQPPRPDDASARAGADEPAAGEGTAAGEDLTIAADTEGLLVTYAADRGEFRDTADLTAIPDAAKGLVRVKLLAGPDAPPGKVWVANLREIDEGGRARLRPLDRDAFEEFALGEGRTSAVELPAGLELPEVAPPSDEIIVYKTQWCGVCKQVMAYLDKKGLAYLAKDIEKDREAAAELAAKSAAAGVSTGSVPVLDVKGQLIVGFDRKRLESLL